jgi:hypothetical protein
MFDFRDNIQINNVTSLKFKPDISINHKIFSYT